MRNFGKINNAFSEVLLESFTKKDIAKKKVFNSYLKAIKESKVLKTQYLIYKNISEKYEENDLKASEYIKESISLMDRFKLNDILESNRKVVKLIGEDSELLDIDYSTKKLHENIDNLIMFNRVKIHKNVDKIVESFNYIFNYIKNNKPVEKIEGISEGVGRLAVNKFNEKYSNINPDEFKLIKSITESDNTGKEKIFKDILTECIDLIDNNLTESDIETKDKLLKVKDKLLRMSYNSESFVSDVSRIIELKRDLK